MARVSSPSMNKKNGGTENKKKQNNIKPISSRSSGSVTLSDVAKLSGCSPITVSRVLNRPELVSTATAEKVHRAISQTGYVPNLLAGGLASSRSKMIAVVIPSIINPVYAESVKSFIDQLRESGYQVLLGESGFSEADEENLLSSILSRRPDAVCLTGISHSAESRRKLLNAKIPVVETWDLTNTPLDIVVGFSHEKIGESVAKFLVEKGYKQFGILSASDSRARIRQRSFLETLGTYGITEVASVVIPAPPDLKTSREGIGELIESGMKQGAIFCSSDTIANGVIIEAAVRGLSIPNDIAIIGFGDQSFSAYTSPALTTVRIDRAEMGKQAATALIGRINGREDVETIIDIGFQIIERNTT